MMNDFLIQIVDVTYKTLLPMALTGAFAFLKKEKHKRKDLTTKWIESLEELKNELANLKTSIEEIEMKSARYRIIRYDDELSKGMLHSKDHRNQILDDIDTYTTYCDNHPNFKNHKGQGAMARILESEELENV